VAISAAPVLSTVPHLWLADYPSRKAPQTGRLLSIYESADCTGYESPESWSTLGMGEPDVSTQTEDAAKAWFVMFRDTVLGLAEALGIELERTELPLEFAKATERVDLGWFLIKEGSTGAVRARWSGHDGERERVRSQGTWYLASKLKEARQDVFDYIEMFYNPLRKHVRNGLLSPAAFERQQTSKAEGV
ncbi:hypothetical protein HNO88_004503, partial [Novosphingobium chloroacetimidivorans]|nr:hypothetical protein [Novosphingobium chloroacetimidivorans]